MTPTFPIFRLALANFVQRRARFALTIAAVALSVALVVAITSGFASVERSIRGFVEDFIGAVDFEITDANDPLPALPPSVVDGLRADPRVDKITTRIESYATPVAADGSPLNNARMMLFGVEEDPQSLGRTPRMDAGRFLQRGDTHAIVVDQNALDALKLKLGDTLEFEGGTHGPLKLTIVGVIHKPAFIQAFFKSGYVAIDELREFVAPDRPGFVTKIRGEFRPDVDAVAFSNQWRDKLLKIDDGFRFKRVRDNRADLDRNLLAMRLASYLASTIGLASAAFIILATLMTGVQEQHRQLAMLRAVGSTRWQVARLVSLEGLAIGLSGAILGVPLGIVGVHAIALIFPQVFEDGVAIAWSGALYAIGVAGLTSLVASIVPAIWASRARPIEAMAAASEPVPRLPWLAIVVGIALVSLDSLIVFAPFDVALRRLGLHLDVNRVRELRLFGHLIVGLPGILFGALLLAPLLVWIIELAGRRVLSTLLRVPPALLKQQLSESPWRSAATGVAMMIGLMLLITMNAQSRSALGAWKLPDKFPDVFMVPNFGAGSPSIRGSDIDVIRTLPELKPASVMPITVNAPLLGQQLFDVAGAKMPTHTLFVGVDPKLAFDLMELDFLGSSREVNARREALAKRMMNGGRAITLADGTTMQATVDATRDNAIDVTTLAGEHRTIPTSDVKSNVPGKYLIVTNEFKKLRGLDVGDTFPFEVDASDALPFKFGGFFKPVPVDFVIVGVVWSPGLDVMLNTFDLPARVKEQTAGLVIGTNADGRDVFHIRDAFCVAANLQPGIQRPELQASLRRALGRNGVTVADIRELKHLIETTFGGIVTFASAIAWAAMAVATLGVGNAIVAAVRTRQWRLGVLRAIGLTRGELLRLLLAEATLLCVVGATLGIAFGILLSANATHLYAVLLGFDPPLVLPWDLIIEGALIVLALGLLATLGPAIAASRRQPLSLLQAGRAAA